MGLRKIFICDLLYQFIIYKEYMGGLYEKI